MLLGLLFVLFAGMSVVAVLWRGKDTLLGYEKLLATTGIGGTDYLLELGGAVTLLNTGTQWSVCDLLCAGSRRKPKWTDDRRNLYHRWIQCDWKTFAEYFPDHGGRLHCEYRPGVDITNPSALLALLFSTTLAPIAGEFGILCGVLAGFLHASVALNVGSCMGA